MKRRPNGEGRKKEIEETERMTFNALYDAVSAVEVI
jgi:hypothetical protein